MPRPDGINPISETRQFTLDKARVVSQFRVDGYTRNSMRLRVEDDPSFLTDDLVLHLEAIVLQDKLPPTKVTETEIVTTPPVPATWWDHFKHEYQDRTWLKHLIVHFKAPLYKVEGREISLTVNLERYISYPEAQNIPENFGRQYHGYKVGTDWSGLR